MDTWKTGACPESETVTFSSACEFMTVVSQPACFHYFPFFFHFSGLICLYSSASCFLLAVKICKTMTNCIKVPAA